MAINPQLQYPGKIAPSSGDYPYGQARNITVPGDGTGTPWEAALVNDLFGFQQALLSEAAIVPSGSSETATVSQYLEALLKLGVRTYDNVALMKTKSIPAGHRVRTVSFYAGWAATASSGPTGGAFYNVVTAAQYAAMFSRPVDDIIHHTLANGNIAVLEHQPGTLNVLQCGADRTGATACTTIVQAMADWLAEETTTRRAGLIIFPDGTYLKGNNTLKRCSVVCNNGVLINADVGSMSPGDYVWESVNTFGDNEVIRGGRIDCGDYTNGIGGIWMRDWGWTVEFVRIDNASTGILSTNFSNSIHRCWLQDCGISVDLAGDGGSGAHDNHVSRIFSVLSKDADVYIRSGTNPRVVDSVFQQQRGDYGIFIDCTVADVGCPQVLNNYMESDTPAISTLLYYVDIASNVTCPRVEGNSMVGRVGSVATAIRNAAASPISVRGNQASQVATFYNSNGTFFGGVIEQNTAVQNVATFVTGTSLSSYHYARNNGLVASNSGSGTITSGTTSVTITHGLGLTPARAQINIVQSSNSTNNPNNIYITNVNATTFDVSVRNDPGSSGFLFDWRAAFGRED